MYDRRPRLRYFEYSGFFRYFLTFCVDQRRCVFTNLSVVGLVREQILSAARANHFAVIAYVFMPDHVHLLVEGKRADADLKAFAHLAKQRTGFVYAREHRHRLWQPSYYDRVLRDDESMWDVIRYIVENPVRAGLVEDPATYLFLDPQ